MNMLTLSKNHFSSIFHISRLAKKKTKEKFVQTVAFWIERYLIITYVFQNQQWKKQLFRIHLPVKLVYGRISIKLGKFLSYPFSYLIHKIFILNNHK